MGRPVLRLATRINRRTRWTAWAIAFACMVLVGSLNLVDGLSAGVGSVTARFSTGPTTYLQGSDLLTSSIDENSLPGIATEYAVLRVHMGLLAINGISLEVPVASLTEYRAGSASAAFPNGSRDLALDTSLRQRIETDSNASLNATAAVTLFGLSPQILTVAPPPTSRPSLLPDTWAWVRPEFFIALSPQEGGPVQAVITPAPLDAALAARLGLTPLQTVGAIGFTQASISEARGVLLGLGAVLAAIIALLAYNSMSLEVHLRREEIRTLRNLGASPATVAAVYQGQALTLAVLGATLGSALGIVVAHGIVAFAPLVGFPNLISLPLPFGPVGLAYGLSVGAAAIGGIVPIRRAARLARSAPEARPS